MTEQTDLVEVVASHDAFICGCDRPKEHMIGARALVQELAENGVVRLDPNKRVGPVVYWNNDWRTVQPLLVEDK